MKASRNNPTTAALTPLRRMIDFFCPTLHLSHHQDRRRYTSQRSLQFLMLVACFLLLADSAGATCGDYLRHGRGRHALPADTFADQRAEVYQSPTGTVRHTIFGMPIRLETIGSMQQVQHSRLVREESHGTTPCHGPNCRRQTSVPDFPVPTTSVTRIGDLAVLILNGNVLLSPDEVMLRPQSECESIWESRRPEIPPETAA